MAKIYIVGGKGTGADSDALNGGGYVPGYNATYSNCQGTNGGPVAAQTNCTTSNSGGSTRVSKNGMGEFASVVTGTLVYFSSATGPVSGIVKVTAIDVSGNYFDMDLPWDSTTRTDMTVNVGGAFDSIGTAKALPVAGDSLLLASERTYVLGESWVPTTGTATAIILIKGVNKEDGTDITDNSKRPVVQCSTDLVGMMDIQDASDYNHVYDIVFDGDDGSGNTGDYAVYNNIGGAYAYNCHFCNCDFKNCDSDGVYWNGRFGGVSFSSCNAYDNDGYGFRIPYSWTSNSILIKCTAKRNGSSGIYLFANPASIIDCVCTDNTTYGIHIYRYFTTTIISGCTVANNGSDGVYVAYGTAALTQARVDNVFADNIIAYNGGYGVNAHADAAAQLYADQIVRNNYIYGNSSGAYPSGIGQFFAHASNVTNIDPLFVDRTNATVALRDYRLKCESTLLHAGLLGTIVGYGALNTIDFPALDAVLTTDTVDGAAGHYYAPAASIVKDGEMFGVDNAEEGEYAGGGGIAEEDIVDAKYVLTGHDNYDGGDPGTLTLPDASDVWHEADDYGVFGALLEPAMRASDITNCIAGNVKKNVVIDNITGTYDPMAAAVFPATANVSTVETAYGPTGAEYAGSLNMSLYVLIANVVDAAFVVTGNNNYVGGSAGTYPTTATSKAEQLAEDVAAVTAAAASIKDDTTILTVTGTYDFTTALAASYADGQAAQLVTDKAAVTAAAGSIKDDATILTIAGTYDFTAAIAAGYADGEAAQLATDAAAVLAVAEYITTDVTDLLGVAGTLDMSLYTLTSGIVFPDEAETWHTAGSYGPTGAEYTAAMYASDIPVTNGIGEYLSAGDIVLGVVVDDLTGTASGGGGGDPPAVPAISLAGGADSITVTIDGDAGVTHYVVYKTSGAAAWTSGGSRSGDGDVVIAGLTAGTTYLVSAYSDNGEYSTFAPVQVVTLTASTSDDPTGSLSVPLGLLAATLAASAAFRAWVGATTGTEQENLAAAQARIYEYESESWTRPYGLVSHDDLWHAGKIADGSHNLFSHDGELFLGFEADAEETGDAELSARRFSNTVGTILDEMKALAGTPGYLNIVDIQIKTGPQRCRPDRRDEADAAEDYWQAEFRIRWSD